VLRVFESGVLRTTFGPKSDELISKWRKLYTEELHNFLLFNKYYSGEEMKYM
jgi:hypothetical protein